MKILHEGQNLQRWHVTFFGGIYSRITHQSVHLDAKKKMDYELRWLYMREGDMSPHQERFPGKEFYSQKN